MCVCAYVYMCVCVYVLMCVMCVHVCAYVCVCMCMCVYVLMCVHVCRYVHTIDSHRHTCRHTHTDIARQSHTDVYRRIVIFYHLSCMLSEYIRTVPHGVEYFREFLRSCEDSFCDVNTFEPETTISIFSD